MNDNQRLCFPSLFAPCLEVVRDSDSVLHRDYAHGKYILRLALGIVLPRIPTGELF